MKSVDNVIEQSPELESILTEAQNMERGSYSSVAQESIAMSECQTEQTQRVHRIAAKGEGKVELTRSKVVRENTKKKKSYGTRSFQWQRK